VFSGMIGVTIFGLIFTPLFYVLASRFQRKTAKAEPQVAAPDSPPV
jgi:hypothetical protein